ncbi:putative tetratricopeptide repeat protein [Blattamonas nauphoetae]|uniref:Tetratricopeptide repeat protein n=1 Tax=Blattamonas nauphoetae TaxID=2049346 RepID=A0ABQ9XK53_9EUKA|nr:putative tetratricopeptide repeat protein [Blattamonas nauphoetae]
MLTDSVPLIPALIRETFIPPDAPSDELNRFLVAMQTYYQDNSYARALRCLEDSVDKWISFCKNGTPPIEVSMYFHLQVGEIQESMGHDDEALASYQAGATISAWLPDGHCDIALPFQALGRLYYNAQRFDKSLECFFRVKTLREEILGTEHIDTNTIYNNLACVLYLQGEYSSAVELLTKSLCTLQKELGIENPRTIIVRRNLTLCQPKVISATVRELPVLPPPPPKPEFEAPKGGKRKGKK